MPAGFKVRVRRYRVIPFHWAPLTFHTPLMWSGRVRLAYSIKTFYPEVSYLELRHLWFRTEYAFCSWMIWNFIIYCSLLTITIISLKKTVQHRVTPQLLILSILYICIYIYIDYRYIVVRTKPKRIATTFQTMVHSVSYAKVYHIS